MAATNNWATLKENAVGPETFSLFLKAKLVLEFVENMLYQAFPGVLVGTRALLIRALTPSLT